MANEKVIPIIDIPYNSVNPRVLVTGDPYRAEKIASLCENVTVLSKTREYWTYNGFYKGVPVTIASNGCGAAGALLCFEGLILAGAKVMIRVGTGGYLAEGYKAGDMLVINAAVREEKVMEQVVPLSYPAVSDIDVTLNLQKAARARGVDVKTGMCVTGGIFYPELLPTNLRLYQKAGVPGYENEMSALLVIAGLKGVKAGGIIAMDGPCFEFVGWENFNHYPDEIKAAKEQQFVIALDALVETEI